MITYPPALRRTGFGPPAAIRHFTAAIAEARNAERPAPGRSVERAAPRPLRPARPYAPAETPPRRVVIRLWLPLTVLFLLLAPFAFLLAPFLYFAPRQLVARPFASVLGLGRVLLALGGTDVDVDTRDARVHIKIV